MAGLWEERYRDDGLQGCQRVIGGDVICVNDYKFYRKKPGGKVVIDKYFGEDRVRRNMPDGP